MVLDRNRARRAFAEYVRAYDPTDPKVRLKIDHTYRVAALCEQIARSIPLSDEEIDRAWLAGLLHDVGRFEQLRRYGTFEDAKSIDHAACSEEVLFVQGHIRDYLDDPSADEPLRTAVRLHSAYRLPEDLDESTLQLCHILRDADKIDILRVNVETPLEEIYNVTTHALRTAGVTPEVLDAFYAHHAVLRALKRTPVDNVVGHASLVYELVFPESLREVNRQGYLWQLLDFQTLNPETARDFAALRRHLRAWLEEAAG